MAWSQRKIEIELKRKLYEDFNHSPAEAEKYYQYYTNARSKLLNDDIFNSIKSLQRDLSDHGENHIMAVLDKAYELLVNRKYDSITGELTEEKIRIVDSIQLYFICVIILFHDVGNLIAEREKHNEQEVIREIYDYVRNGEKEFEYERILVPEVASKHSGVAADGSMDTIAELGIETPYLFSKKIFSKKCASVLRFADELEEDFHRTSIFMNKYYNYPYKIDSRIYHKYAEITKRNIDRESERICLSYTFHVEAVNGSISKEAESDFQELFNYAIKRMLKVEAERKYCKYYCDWLSPFKRTHVTFNFFIDNNIKGKMRSRRIFPVMSELNLDDLVLPVGETTENFYNKHIEYMPESVLNSLKVAFNER